MLYRFYSYTGGLHWVDELILELVASLRRAYAPWYWEPSLEEVSGWFRWGSGYSFVLALAEETKRVVAYSWAVVTKRGGYMTLTLRPDLRDPWLVEALLSHGFWWLRSRGVSGAVEVYAGREHGWERVMLQHLLGGVPVHRTTLMIAERREVKKVGRREGVVVREYEEWMLEQLVRVFNNAFSRYDWFNPLSLEEFRSWIESVRPRILVAMEDGRVIGFTAYRRYRAIDGVETVYIEDLAVDPSAQGRGVGSTLLAEVFEREADAEKMVLDAVAGLEPYYARFGFRVHHRYVAIRAALDSLPRRVVAVESLG